jgi:hypothetical protein
MPTICFNLCEDEKLFHRAISIRRKEKSIADSLRKAIRFWNMLPDDFLKAMGRAAFLLDISMPDLIVLMVQSQAAQVSAFEKVFGVSGQGITRALKYHRAEDEINMDTLSVKLQNDYAKAYQNLKDKIVTARTTGKDIYMTHQEAEIFMPEIRAGT